MACVNDKLQPSPSFSHRSIIENKELKECGHFCFPSSTPLCCSCSDLRPDLGGIFYPIYADGRGWVDEGKIFFCILQDYHLQLFDKGARDDGYCPVCNNKNFERWLVELEIQREAKGLQLTNLKKQQEQSIIEAQIDKPRAASAVINLFSQYNYHFL